MRQATVERVHTGIAELDTILDGGFVRGSMILLTGNAGAGKTIMSTQFINAGALKGGEKGLYVSFAENHDDYYRNMQEVGLDLKKLEAKGLFRFMEFPNMTKEGMADAIKAIVAEISSSGTRRLVIDSASSLIQVLGETESRRVLHSVFGKMLKKSAVTTIIIGEIPYGEEKTGFGIEEFVADGVIILKTEAERNSELKRMYIMKMRGSNIQRIRFEYVISKRNGGLGIIALPTRTNMLKATLEKLSSGVKGLDTMLCGGVYRDSITLIEGAGGVGKTTLCIHFLSNNAQRGERAMLITLEEPAAQLYRMMDNFHIDYKKSAESLRIETYVPEALSPLQYYTLLKEGLDAYKPSILAIDSISSIKSVFPEREFAEFMRYLQILCKEEKLTVFVTSTLGKGDVGSEANISTLADNIILMRYYELKDRMARELTVVKSRGSPHEKRLMAFEITNRGMKVNI